MLSILAISAGFTSCDDDDDEWNATGDGQVEMAKTRAFVLNEGSMNKNNAGITYFDWTTDVAYGSDLFMAQNKRQLGDVGQDIIVDKDNNLYVIVNNSSYISKLDEHGVEKATLQISESLGLPRYGVIVGKYLYVTCYGGFIVKIKTSDMTIVGQVAVGKNPEYIIAEGGYLYCTNSGWGSDNRVAKVKISEFKNAEFIEVMSNPDRIVAVDGHIFVQGYDVDYSYPWGELKADGTFEKIGNASAWAVSDNTIYLALSMTDWNTYATTTTFATYDVKTATLTDIPSLPDAPEELYSSSVYGISVNPYTKDFYIMTTDFANNGTINHFTKDGTFVKQFNTTGINPRKIVFLK